MGTTSLEMEAISERKAANAIETDTKRSWVLKYCHGAGVTRTMSVSANLWNLEDALKQLPADARFVSASHQTKSSVDLSKEGSKIWTQLLKHNNTSVHTGIGG